MPKKIIKCPICLERGLVRNLAERLPTGYISVQRFHHKSGGVDCTYIGGTDFYVMCGDCGSTVYVHQTEVVGTSSFSLTVGTLAGTILV